MHKEAFFCVFLSTFATRYAERKDDIVPSRILCQRPVRACCGTEGGIREKGQRADSRPPTPPS